MAFVNKVITLFSDSFVNRSLQSIVSFFQKLLVNSAIIGFFAKYEKFESAVTESFLFKNYSEFYSLKRKKIHIFFAGMFENSRIYNKITEAYKNIMGIQTSQFGAGILGLGITCAVISVFLYYTGRVSVLFDEKMILGILICLLSVIFMIKKDSLLSVLLLNSQLVRFFIINIGDIREESLIIKTEKEKKYSKALFYGVAVAIPLIFIDFYTYLLLIFAFIFLIIIFNSPEFGLISILFAIPFLKVSYLLILIISVFFSLIFKTARGKRFFKITILDFFIFAFAVCLIYSLMISIAPSASIKKVIVYLVFLSVYYLCAKLINTKKYAYLSCAALFFSVAVSSFLGVYGNIFGRIASLFNIDTHMFFEITPILKGPFESPTVYGQFLAAFLPLAVAFFFIKKGLSRWIACLVAVIMFISIIYVYSDSAVISAVAGTLVFIIFFNNFLVKLFMAGAITFPFLTRNFSVTSSLNRLFDTAYTLKYKIWQGSYYLAKEVWTTGIGTGSGAFILAYPMFSVAEAVDAIHSHNLYLQVVIDYGLTGAIILFCIVAVFASIIITGLIHVKDAVLNAIILAMGCGMITLLVGAATEYIWYNPKIFLVFFVLIGIAQGSFNAYKKLRREYL